MPYIAVRLLHALDMYIEKHLLLLFLFLLLSPLTGAGQFHDTEWLEEGLLAEFRGDHERALSIWTDARNELDEPDSRIGIEYIRVATEQGMSEHYEEATDMYMWAISSPFSGLNRLAVRREIERLRPVLGDGIYRQWMDWIENQNSTLAADIRGFWIQMDPTPGKAVNERLIEHWQRIAYAKENFTKDSNTVYGTDDRALTYIRYGRPDIHHAGSMTLDQQNLGRWLEQQFHIAERADDPEEYSPSILFDESDEAADSFSQLEEYVFQYHEYPEYEIWIYHPFTDNLVAPLIFIFGTEARSGDFRRVNSLDDFIPNRAYLYDQNALKLQARFIRQGLSPALVLQLLYYEQLAALNTYFQDRLNSIREAFIDQGPLTYSSLDLFLKAQNREILEMRVAEAPVEVSDADRTIPSIPVDVHQYRLLDEESNPLIVTFLESNPANALRQDLKSNLRQTDDTYHSDPDSLIREMDHIVNHQLDHIFIVYDQEWEEEERNDHSPDISFTESSAGTIVQSVFQSPHLNQNFQAVSAQLLNLVPESIFLFPSIFPPELRGLGTLKSQQPAPLHSYPDSLQLGDLILGYHDELPEDYPFDFRVANDQTISSDESLILHFEVYNLQPAESTGFTRFELTYRIYPVLEDGTLRTDQEAFYLTINFEDDQTRVIEDLEIQTTTLSSGLYELQVYIEDMVSTQLQRRDIRFEVTQ